MSIERRLQEAESKAARLIPDIPGGAWDLAKLTTAELMVLRTMALKAAPQSLRDGQTFDPTAYARDLRALLDEVSEIQGWGAKFDHARFASMFADGRADATPCPHCGKRP